jgi:hypothetical protein
MSKLSDVRHRAVKAWPFQTLPTLDWSAQGLTYREADPGVIRAAVARAQCRPSGNWFAFAASSQIATKTWGTTAGGVEIVAWRGADGALRVAPRECPHLGADLATAAVECGTLVSPWHGPRLSDQSRGAWQPVSGPRRRCVVLGSPRRRRQRGAHRRSNHPGPPAESATGRGDPTRRCLSALRCRRQQAGSVARCMVSPVLLHSPGGAEFTGRGRRPSR